jgi:hypothetical protein
MFESIYNVKKQYLPDPLSLRYGQIYYPNVLNAENQ